MIQEREAEIREIETGIHEISQIFRDLGTLVQEQGGLIGCTLLCHSIDILLLTNLLSFVRGCR